MANQISEHKCNSHDQIKRSNDGKMSGQTIAQVMVSIMSLFVLIFILGIFLISNPTNQCYNIAYAHGGNPATPTPTLLYEEYCLNNDFDYMEVAVIDLDLLHQKGFLRLRRFEIGWIDPYEPYKKNYDCHAWAINGATNVILGPIINSNQDSYIDINEYDTWVTASPRSYTLCSYDDREITVYTKPDPNLPGGQEVLHTSRRFYINDGRPDIEISKMGVDLPKLIHPSDLPPNPHGVGGTTGQAYGDPYRYYKK